MSQTNSTDKNKLILRFKFDNEIINQIEEFARIHKLDDLKSYKEAWDRFSIQNEEILKKEKLRLNNLGYKGNIDDKLFKAARYYFRKKSPIKSPPKERRQYISMDSEIIQSMDSHINSFINQNIKSPAQGYDEFCKMHIEVLSNEIYRITQENDNISKADLISKFKKTYKNRYFIANKQVMSRPL